MSVSRLSILCGAVLAMVWLGIGPAYATAPTITSFTPTSGGYDTAVIINGTGFTVGSTVKFGGVAARTVVFSSTTKLVAHVPLTAPSGPISVTSAGGTVVSAASFTVTAWVSPAPLYPPPGTVTTARLGGFAPGEAIDVYLGTTPVAIAVSGSTGTASIDVTVPATTPPGVVWMTAVGRHSGLAAQHSITVRTNWNQFGGGPAHHGVNSYENVLSPATVGELDEDWSFGTGSGISSAAAVNNGVFYVPGEDGRLYAVTARTGAMKWSYSTTATLINSSPAVSDGVVYFGAVNGVVYAVNAADGSLKWSYPTGFDIVTSSPAVAGGLVYIGSEDGSLYALNAKTGAVRWSFPTGAEIDSSPAVSGGRVFFGTSDGYVYALDAATGAHDWDFAVGAAVASSPTVYGGAVYVGAADGHLYALRAAYGIKIWDYPTGGEITSTPAVVDGTVFFGSFDKTVYALRTADGTLKWAVPTAGGEGIESSPVVANGVVYIGASFTVYALDETNGADLWSVETGGAVRRPVTVNDGTVTVGAEDGALRHYTLPAGITPQARRPAVSELTG